MNVQEIANNYVNYCRTGQQQKCQDELYCNNAVSCEPAKSQVPVAEGLDAIRAKGQKWGESLEELHSMEVSDPIVAGNHFTCTMKLDVTHKGAPRQQMEEVCVYEVKDGKIVKEEFFY